MNNSGIRFIVSSIIWVLATYLGWMLALVIAAMLSTPGRTDVPDVLNVSLAGMAGGVAMGLIQWLILRRWLRQLWLWAVPSGLGFMLALAIIEALGGSSGKGTATGVSLVLIWALGGAAMGLLQALGASRIRGATWWVLSHAIAWAVLVWVARVLPQGSFLWGVLAQALVSWVGVVLVVAKSRG
ncbi:MAG: hypothetical protein KIH69_010360 [Anaerolineae bacterium]|nr:hypothetical protein [Anaerolineae bacterium]